MSLLSGLPKSIASALADAGQDHAVWLVGGAVRDRFLRRTPLDFDFVVEGNARGVARRVAQALGAGYFDLDKQRGTGRVLWDRPGEAPHTLDFAEMRGEDIDADLRARDFTINALAVDLRNPDKLIDPTGGLQDLKDKILRPCSPQAIEADPVRALRAVRIASEIGLRMDLETLDQMARAVDLLDGVAPERRRDELMRTLDHHRPAQPLRVLEHLGLLKDLFPELAALRVNDGDWQSPLEHALLVVDKLSRLLAVLGREHQPEGAADLTLAQIGLRIGRFRESLGTHLETRVSRDRKVRPLLFLAALYHEAGDFSDLVSKTDIAAATDSMQGASARLAAFRGREMHLSNREIKYIGKVVRFFPLVEAMEAVDPIPARQVYRFFNQAGEAGVGAVLLSMGDLLGKYAEPAPQDAWSRRVDVARVLLEAFFEHREEHIDPPALLSGHELMQELGIDPGPALGRYLEMLREAQVAGEISTRAQAFSFLEREIHSNSPNEG